MGLEVCERVSPRARACTPLMAPSGYSRRTLSYLLFSVGCRRKREEKEKNRRERRRWWWWWWWRKVVAGGAGRGTRIYPQTSHTSWTPEFRRVRFRDWKPREINADTGVSHEEKPEEESRSHGTRGVTVRSLIAKGLYANKIELCLTPGCVMR